MHLGNARTFLLAWLSVRSRGGTLVLRVEDLDHPKVKPGAAAAALEDLRWLGLDWDEGPDAGGPHGPYVQSLRRASYRAALDALLAKGLAYPCTCSRRDVADAQSAPHGRDPHSLAYSGACRGRYASWDEAAAALPAGRVPAWRFRTPPGISSFDDVFLGRKELDLAGELGDFAFARDRDGAGYQLACTLDDAAMGVTEVLRGDDLVDATHCQLAIQAALGLPRPVYAHVPLVVAEDGRRLAKRHGDTRICALREAGLPPERVVGLLAWWSGLAPYGAETRPADLVRGF
ncbi:MAG: tRNA glutamyl-Q(34) synthetase GluQRS, partial [Kiritimatiellae bacterium]|nr:tRNA glutamyl-Q(34) synthetase GluQRS [Kiritimatiellia bacterium]